MDRDMDLIRDLLIKIKDNTDGESFFEAGNCMPGIDYNKVRLHLELMEESGLFAGGRNGVLKSFGYSFQIRRLSNYGYDFLEQITNDEIWEKTKTEIKEKKLPRTIEWIAKVAGIFWGSYMKNRNE